MRIVRSLYTISPRNLQDCRIIDVIWHAETSRPEDMQQHGADAIMVLNDEVRLSKSIGLETPVMSTLLINMSVVKNGPPTEELAPQFSQMVKVSPYAETIYSVCLIHGTVAHMVSAKFHADLSKKSLFYASDTEEAEEKILNQYGKHYSTELLEKLHAAELENTPGSK